MALNELKQTEAEIREYGVQSAPDKLSGSAAENKKVFDRLFQNVGMTKFNQLIEYLLDGTAATEQGILDIPELGSAKTVQAALEALTQSMKDVTQGAVANGSITTEKLADMAVTGPKLAARSVSAQKIALAAIVTELLADQAVTEQKIALLAITTALLADKAVTEAKIADGAVTAAKLGVGSVGTGKLAAKAVTKEKLAETYAVPSVAKTATLAAASWASKKQTVSVSGVTAGSHVIIAPDPAYYVAYSESMVRCVTQAAGSLTFQCEDVPATALTVNILIVG